MNKNKKHWKALIAVFLAVIVILTPPNYLTSAAVSDNMGTSILEQLIGSWTDSNEAHTIFGMLKQIVENVVWQKERIQSIEAKVEALDAKLDDQMVAINNIYRVSASNAYSASQVKSTKASAVSPKQVMLQWNCSQDTDCTTSTAASYALSDWTNIKAFNVYYGSSTNTARMTYYGTINRDEAKLFYQNYSYVVSGLAPDTVYYFWVTCVMQDDTELIDSSAVRTIRTYTLGSAQAKNLIYSLNNGTTLDLTWHGNYDGYVSYRVYWGTSPLNITSATPANDTTSSKNYTITGLAAGQSYYVAVCAVLDDGTTWVSDPGTLNICGHYMTAMTCPAGNFATAASWADVQRIMRHGRAGAQGFAVGQTRTIDLSSMGTGTATVTLVDMSADGRDITCMITAYKYTAPSHKMYESYTNSNSWELSTMRTWLNGDDYYGCFPADLKAVIADSSVTTGTYNGTSSGGSNRTTTDKLFLPAEKEVFGSKTRSTDNEANALTQFAYFKNGGNKNFNDSYWWLRSPDSSNEAYSCYVNRDFASSRAVIQNIDVFPAFNIK